MAGCVKTCDCNYSMTNTGAECTPLMEVTKKLMLMPVYDSTGVRNYIDLTTTLDEAYFTGLVNQTDASKRLFPLPALKDIKDSRGNPIVQKFADDSTIYVRDGIRAFDGMIPGRDGNPIMKAKIEAARCGELGVFLVDRKGGLIGAISDDGTKLYPVRLDSESVSAQYIRATDTTVQALQLTFNFHPDESDSCLRIVLDSEMGDADLLTLKGLVNVYATFSSVTATGAHVKLYTEYGTIVNPNTVKGLVTADFVSAATGTASKVRNQTSGTDVTVTATESTTSPGTYTLAWASQTTGNKIAIDCKKDGFDFTAVAAAPITMP